MDKIKHFFSLIGFIFIEAWKQLRMKRTWVIVGLIVWTYLISWFSSNYYIQSPVKEWRCMVCSRYPKKAPVSVKRVSVLTKEDVIDSAPKAPQTEEQIVKSQKHGDILWKIYFLESTHGKNDACRKSGKFGGFGVMNDKNTPACYDTFQLAADRAEYWFAKALEGHTLAEALCIWNTGKVQPMCNYSMTFDVL